MLTALLIYFLSVYVGRDPCAEVGILAPFRTARVYLRIGHHITALAAFHAWFILEKFD
jgi:tyrosyl-tRNA synthetase